MEVTMTKNRKIKVNAAKCMKCGDFLISKDPDVVLYCECGTIWIGGGTDKILRGGAMTFLHEMAVVERM